MTRPRLPKRILVPVDFSPPSENALDYAIELARTASAEVIVLHAYPVVLLGYLDVAWGTVDIMGSILNAANESMQRLVDARKGKGVAILSLVQQNDPWHAILAAAEENKCDLIVMSTHGRQGIAHALIGSVAEKVIRTAPCPVLTIRPPESREHKGREAPQSV